MHSSPKDPSSSVKTPSSSNSQVPALLHQIILHHTSCSPLRKYNNNANSERLDLSEAFRADIVLANHFWSSVTAQLNYFAFTLEINASVKRNELVLKLRVNRSTSWSSEQKYRKSTNLYLCTSPECIPTVLCSRFLWKTPSWVLHRLQLD